MPDWMAFNVDDYVSNTLHLTARQHGGYILLICAAWKAKGYLPGSDASLMAIAKLQPREWKEDGPVLKAFLTRSGEEWVHERVEFEWSAAQSIIDAKSRAGKEGARKRWHGRANGKPNGSAITDTSQTDRQIDAPIPLPLPSVTTTPTVSPNARERATAPGRASLIRDDWQPSEIAIAQLRKGRPDLVGAFFDQRMTDFRLWCRDKAVMSHDPEAAWLGFMRKSKAESAPNSDDEVAAALERSKLFGQPGYVIGKGIVR